jgi:hypothetical protein
MEIKSCTNKYDCSDGEICQSFCSNDLSTSCTNASDCQDGGGCTTLLCTHPNCDKLFCDPHHRCLYKVDSNNNPTIYYCAPLPASSCTTACNSFTEVCQKFCFNNKTDISSPCTQNSDCASNDCVNACVLPNCGPPGQEYLYCSSDQKCSLATDNGSTNYYYWCI